MESYNSPDLSHVHPPFVPTRRRKWTGEFAVEELVGHRWKDTGFEFLVRWEAGPRGGEWEDSWEPLKNIQSGLVDTYFSSIAVCESKQVTCDVAPLIHLVRTKVAQSVAHAKTKARPREHVLALECLASKELAMAFLQVVRSPTAMYKWQCKWLNSMQGEEGGHSKLPLVYTKDKDGVETFQVNYTSIKHVAAFCSFHSFLGHKQGVGALRYDIGRDSCTDYMVVGIPMAFKVSLDRVRVWLPQSSSSTPAGAMACMARSRSPT